MRWNWAQAREWKNWCKNAPQKVSPLRLRTTEANLSCVKWGDSWFIWEKKDCPVRSDLFSLWRERDSLRRELSCNRGEHRICTVFLFKKQIQAKNPLLTCITSVNPEAVVSHCFHREHHRLWGAEISTTDNFWFVSTGSPLLRPMSTNWIWFALGEVPFFLFSVQEMALAFLCVELKININTGAAGRTACQICINSESCHCRFVSIVHGERTRQYRHTGLRFHSRQGWCHSTTFCMEEQRVHTIYPGHKTADSIFPCVVAEVFCWPYRQVENVYVCVLIFSGKKGKQRWTITVAAFMVFSSSLVSS